MKLSVLRLVTCLVAVCVRPAAALDGRQLALIVNTSDPLSVQIGDYYAEQRRIVFSNVIRVSFAPSTFLSLPEFNAVKASIDEQTLPNIQAYAVTWAEPYRVECMSLTSALTFGFDLAYCADKCKPTRASRYYDSRATLPFAQLKIRPTMAIAATSFAEAKALIDRGVESDGSEPVGTAYLLSTSDKARNVRASIYPVAEEIFKRRIYVRIQKRDAILYARDVLFYFTGTTHVEGLNTLHFLPGAIADHLTSSGGQLTDSAQMSALRWLEAGATGSYGTVVEPCAMPQKFPNPAVVAKYYLAGETLIEAYWKSVAMPGQGIFIGEPLAAPFRKKK